MVNVILKGISKEALQYAANAIKMHRPAVNQQGTPPSTDDIIAMAPLLQEARDGIASVMQAAAEKEATEEQVKGNMERAARDKKKRSHKKKPKLSETEDDE